MWGTIKQVVPATCCWFVGVEVALEVDEEGGLFGAPPKGLAVWPPKAVEVDEVGETTPNPPLADEAPPVDDDDSTSGLDGLAFSWVKLEAPREKKIEMAVNSV